MASKRKTSRRDFLRGKSAAAAVGELADAITADDTNQIEIPSPDRAGGLVRFERKAMACLFAFFFNQQHAALSAESAIGALDLIDVLEQQMTVYRDESDLMQINRQAASGPVEVESQLFQLLATSVQLFEETGGAFDITSGPLSKVWGFYRRQASIPTVDALADALQQVGSNHLVLDHAAQTIQFLIEGAELNLGSIGKGYALDRAGELLRESGTDDFLLHGGLSSVLASGSEMTADAEESSADVDNEKGWSVGVVHPLRPAQRIAKIRLHNRALATSGSATQFFRHGARRYGHILDPRTGWPTESVLSATVVTERAAMADALATSFYVMGPQEALQFCRNRKDIAMMMVIPGESVGSVKIVHHGFEPDQLELVAAEEKA